MEYNLFNLPPLPSQQTHCVGNFFSERESFTTAPGDQIFIRAVCAGRELLSTAVSGFTSERELRAYIRTLLSHERGNLRITLRNRTAGCSTTYTACFSRPTLASAYRHALSA